MEKLFYHRNTIGACGSVVASVMARIRSGWSNFKNLVSFLGSKYLLLEPEADYIPAFVGSVILYGSDNWTSKEEDGCSMLGPVLGL